MPKFQFASSSLKWPDLDFFLRWDELQHSGGSKRQKRDSSSKAASSSRIHEQFTNYLLRTSSSEVGLADFVEDKRFTYLKHINKALADRDNYNPSTFEKEADNYLKV